MNKFSFKLIFIFILSGLTLIIISGLIGYLLGKKQISVQSINQLTPTPFVSPTSTQIISTNEILGIQINTCCSCPTKINKLLVGTDGWVIYEMGKNYSSLLPKYCEGADCAPCPPLTDNNIISFDQLNKGWYWGSSDQKLLGTPSDWIYQEAGRSSCWHKPEVNCI
ncbi:MAG: hypothetical protein V1803_01865 [Candidatus Roizmanbacteria bacterium]